MNIQEIINEAAKLKLESALLQEDLNEAREELSIEMSLRFGREEMINRFKSQQYDKLSESFRPITQDEDMSIFCSVNCSAFQFGHASGYHRCCRWPGWALFWLDCDHRRPIRCKPCLQDTTAIESRFADETGTVSGDIPANSENSAEE